MQFSIPSILASYTCQSSNIYHLIDGIQTGPMLFEWGKMWGFLKVNYFDCPLICDDVITISIHKIPDIIGVIPTLCPITIFYFTKKNANKQFEKKVEIKLCRH